MLSLTELRTKMTPETDRQIAEKLGVTWQYVRMIRVGERKNPSYELVERLNTILNTTTE